jgi:hypothetical protein
VRVGEESTTEDKDFSTCGLEIGVRSLKFTGHFEDVRGSTISNRNPKFQLPVLCNDHLSVAKLLLTIPRLRHVPEIAR